MRPRGLNVVAFLVVLVFAAVGGKAVSAQVKQKNRIAEAIDNSQMVTLRGNVHPLARSEHDQGKVDSSLRIEHITMMLQRTAAQQTELDALLVDQQNPTSPNYHRWLSPEEFADRFGVSQEDMDKIAGWLQAQGFAVELRARSRNWVMFSGTAAQVQAVLRTEMHRYTAQGQTFYANASEPSVPGALSGVVQGFSALNSFRLMPRGIRSTSTGGAVHADFTSSISGSHFLAPDDFATIYDLKPLYNTGIGGIKIDGTGQTIAVMGQSNIVIGDIRTFRSLSGLPASDPQLMLVPPGTTDPGVVANDVAEASLDIEWSGAVAPKATILYVYSTKVFTALQYAIDNNLAPVISISYGGCERVFGQSDFTSFASTAQQANAQGMTIVAPSGDSGATDCDNTLPATLGLVTDFPASLPYVTAIGGTEFNEGNGTFWNSTNNANNGSAISYIPEIVWNDTSVTNGFSAGGGGKSSVFSKPVWQTGSGVPNDQARDVPDISLNASSNHDGYLVCTEFKPAGSQTLTSSCVNGFRYTDNSLQVFGGTSVGVPTFAGFIALMNQLTGTAQGNVNYILYPLAASAPSAFHDITTGDNKSPCSQGTPDCLSGGSIGFSAGAGYDQATGLGSIDAFNLASAWITVATLPGTTPTLTSISPTTAAAGSAAITLTATGSNFASTAQILWNNSANGVTMLSGGTSTSIRATITSSLLAFGTVASVTVINQVSPKDAGSAVSSFTVTAGSPPANDNIAAALAVSANPFTGTVDNSAATTETTDPTPPCVTGSTNPRTKTVWWVVTAGASGTVTADTIGSPYDTTLSVWTGLPGTLALVVCNDDITSGQITQSRVTFSATAGTRYFFMVAPFGPPNPVLDQMGGQTVLNVTGITASALNASPLSMAVNAGASATFSISNTSSSTFALTCSGLPTGAACNTASVGPNASASLVITTTARALIPPSIEPFVPLGGMRVEIPALLLMLLAMLTFFRSSAARRYRLASISLVVLVLALAVGATSCGGGGSSGGGVVNPPAPIGTPAGSYAILVTGTSGTTTQSTTVFLTVN